MSGQQYTTHVLDEAALSAMVQAVAAQPLAPQRRQALREQLLARLDDASAPEGSYTIRATAGEWVEITPLIAMKMLRLDRQQKNQTALWRLQPGAVAPAHFHTQEEECMVLEGEIRMGRHTVRQGDMHIALLGSADPPITTERGALLLVRAELGDLQSALSG